MDFKNIEKTLNELVKYEEKKVEQEIFQSDYQQREKQYEDVISQINEIKTSSTEELLMKKSLSSVITKLSENSSELNDAILDYENSLSAQEYADDIDEALEESSNLENDKSNAIFDMQSTLSLVKHSILDFKDTFKVTEKKKFKPK
tara:strand:- start:1008 stop:1445 length:438 start_codon:yes stop_codon:yes gene_type:complete